MKIKVLHVIKSLGRGGAEMLLPETLKLHDQDNFEFHYIYFLPWKNQMVSALESQGAKVTCLRSKNNIELLFQFFKLIKYCRKNNINLMHAHLPWAGLLARFIYIFFKIPLIYTEHNKQERYHKLTFWLNRLTFNWQTKVIAVSGDVASSIKNNIRPQIPIQIVLNGVNTVTYRRKSLENILQSIDDGHIKENADSFNDGSQNANNLHFDDGINVLKTIGDKKRSDAQAMVVGTVAVFRFQKRLIEWVDVFQTAAKKNQGLIGVIVGNGPFAEQLIEHRNKSGLKGRLFFPGLQTNTKDWFSIMDIFMMTSEFEGLPVALLEAMSMKCAIATTNAGGIKEVITEGETGLMVNVEDWNNLTDKLNLLADDNLRNRLSINARAHVETNFSLIGMVKSLEKVYRNHAKL